MCYALKYGVWNYSQPQPQAVNALISAGYGPLVSMVLACRGMEDPRKAEQYLSCSCALPEPFLMKDMLPAVQRINRALQRREKIAVFGDYDVDGITATCLLTDFLRRRGADCIPYIPGRLEEGYGLNPIAIHGLREQGVKLIVTVDCGITAVEEARLCKQLGIDLVITDHHECKEMLPLAVAVVDPHRPDGGYPHLNLSGVGVAFKLASAICGSQRAVLESYADMVCLGTVADVMLLTGENRVFVERGLQALRQTQRPGIAALIKESGCDAESLTASSVGYILAPRINAAGRMGKIDLAVELFLTQDPQRASQLAKGLCELNRQRQAVESEIYEQAAQMLPEELPDAIVLADENWHQGVVGIVASRMAEEYCCPTFLICLDGEHGKASSRSYGGFNLFASLKELSPLLESYGGHELAAGFTISKEKIPAFRERIGQLARKFYAQDCPRTVLDADCAVTPELLSLNSVEELSCMEPCGNGCPKPLLVMEKLRIDKIGQVGSGRHMRLQLSRNGHSFQAIYFSANAQSASVCQGDLVDVAFMPQINEYRGMKSVQMNLQDIRPHCDAPCLYQTAGYRALQENTLDREWAEELLPERSTLATVWRYLAASPEGVIQEEPMCLCRKIVRWWGQGLSLAQLLTCLDIFRDVGLLETENHRKYMTIRLCPGSGKADLNESATMQRLIAAKES